MTQWKLVPDWPLPVQINTAHDQFGMEGPDPELVYRAMVTSPFDAPDVIGALEEAALQIEYLHDKFVVTGSGNSAAARIRSVLSQLKGE
jgi:hypothetical protein